MIVVWCLCVGDRCMVFVRVVLVVRRMVSIVYCVLLGCSLLLFGCWLCVTCGVCLLCVVWFALFVVACWLLFVVCFMVFFFVHMHIFMCC